MKQLIQNEVNCLKCGDIIWSGHRHGFATCSCGAVSVDGGLSYLRRCGNREDWEERSLSTDREELTEIIKKVSEAPNSGKVEIINKAYGTTDNIYKNQDLFNKCYEAVHWAVDNNRNSIGIVFAVIRVLRDNEILNMEKFNNG
jgi:hypothetical protein